MKAVRRALLRWVKAALEDTEDDIAMLSALENIPDTESLDSAVKNHIWHAIGSLHVRVGRLEGKMGVLIFLSGSLVLMSLQNYLGIF